MQRAISSDFNEMVMPILGLAESMLEVTGEFRPFGARVAAGGQMH